MLYAQEYSYEEEFGAFTAEIVAKFIQHYDAKRERCWIPEKGGDVVGSVFLVAKSSTTAKLRLLYVEPSARGLGIGSRAVSECVRFARQAVYRKMVLWTQSELDAARHIYKKAGFRVVEKKPHHSLAKSLSQKPGSFASRVTWQASRAPLLLWCLSFDLLNGDRLRTAALINLAACDYFVSGKRKKLGVLPARWRGVSDRPVNGSIVGKNDEL